MNQSVEPSLLNFVQITARNRLKSDPFFEFIPVLHERVKDIEFEVEKAVSQLGLCVIILTPEATVNDHKDCPFPFFDRISVVVQVVEQPTINRRNTGLQVSAAHTAEQVALLLHFFHGKNLNPFFLDDPSISLVPDEDFLIYQVRFATSAGFAKAQKVLTADTTHITADDTTHTADTTHQ